MVNTDPAPGHVLVTGASAGLGVAFAHAFAERGRDLVLVARRGERLEALRAELTARHGVDVRVFVLDLLCADAPAMLARWCVGQELVIDVLVNNAGFGCHGHFVELDGLRQADMVRLNAVIATELTHHFATAMVARRRGGILNVASTASFMPGPGMAVYYASKAYLLSFSEALTSELAPHGVTVTALCPGPTETEFRSVAGRPRSKALDGVAMDARVVALAGVRGLERGSAIVVPGAFNKFCALAVRFVPRAVMRRIIARLQS